jgi:hypothetical protein
METDEAKRFSNCFINIIITQALCVLIILLAVLLLKYFFKPEFSKLKGWYQKNICNDTYVEEVLS